MFDRIFLKPSNCVFLRASPNSYSTRVFAFGAAFHLDCWYLSSALGILQANQAQQDSFSLIASLTCDNQGELANLIWRKQRNCKISLIHWWCTNTLKVVLQWVVDSNYNWISVLSQQLTTSVLLIEQETTLRRLELIKQVTASSEWC